VYFLCTRATYRKRWLGLLTKEAINERKLENKVVAQTTGHGVPITGFEAPQVSQIRWSYLHFEKSGQ
jgi:hypothetical protein